MKTIKRHRYVNVLKNEEVSIIRIKATEDKQTLGGKFLP